MLQDANIIEKKLEELQTFDLSYFLSNIILGDHSSRNMFVFQTTSSIFRFKRK